MANLSVLLSKTLYQILQPWSVKFHFGLWLDQSSLLCTVPCFKTFLRMASAVLCMLMIHNFTSCFIIFIRAFSMAAPMLWNNLPLLNATSITTFKRALKTYVVSGTFDIIVVSFYWCCSISCYLPCIFVVHQCVFCVKTPSQDVLPKWVTFFTKKP